MALVDPPGLSPGIVHLGLGAFARAHLIPATEAAMAALADGIEVAVGIIEERHIEHAAALVRQHRVVGEFFRLPALAPGLRTERAELRYPPP